MRNWSRTGPKTAQEKPLSRPGPLRSRDGVRPTARGAAPLRVAAQGEPSPSSPRGLAKDRRRRRQGNKPPHARGSPSRSRRRTTQAQHAPAAPPVRRLDEKRAQRVRRLAPLDVDGSVAPARRPRLAPAFARSWERRTNSRDSGRAVAVQGRRPAVYTYTIKADAEPATEFQRDASTKAPGDGSL